jgi:hypothetical protein
MRASRTRFVSSNVSSSYYAIPRNCNNLLSSNYEKRALNTLAKIKDSGEVLVYIFTGYGWFKIWEKSWNFVNHLHTIFDFILMLILIPVLFLGFRIIHYLGTTKKHR